MNRVLVVGGTGTVGREAVKQLLDAGAAVRAMVRNPERADLPPGVEAVSGDLTAPESFDGCMEEIDGVFLVWTSPAETVAPVIQRIAARARRIVYLSAPLQTPHPMFQNPQPNAGSVKALQIEKAIREFAAEWTFVRPGMFASNSIEWWARQIRAGDVVRWPYVDAPSAPIDPRDIAAVAVRALCDPRHTRGDFIVTGPESLSLADQIRIIGRAIGRSLHVVEMTPEEMRREWTGTWPLPLINMLLTAWEGAMGQPAWMTETVEEVTGRPARRFSEWARDHAAVFRG